MATKPAARRAATLTIKAPGKMTKRGRNDIASWLRQQAKNLQKHGENYTSGQFQSGFNYTPR